MVNAKPHFDYDVAVIGGGSGGFAAARTAATAGLRVAVLEGGEHVGGLCILRGCMPTKALLYASDVIHLARRAHLWGLRIPEVGYDFARVMERKNVLIKEFADYRQQQLSGGKFAMIRALARFTDEHTVELSTGGKLTAGSFVIGTGSKVAPSPLPSLDQAGYLTSDSALELTELPKSIIVLGGGAVAVEFAQFFARFGVQTSIIQRSNHILRDFDDDVADEVETVFRKEGLDVMSCTQLLDSQRQGDLKTVTFQHQNKTITISGEEIFFALGRVPNIHFLDLDQAGVRVEQGRIFTGETMQTSVPHIYAVGDCAGPHEIVHIAIQQGETAAHNIAHPQRQRRMDYRLLTAVVFTDPQVATVGLSERCAIEAGIPYLAAKYLFSDHGKSLIMEARDGFVKLLADPASGEILGGAIVGPAGGELIHEITAAMYKRMTVHELAAMPHYHPTLAEIWTYPAEELAEQIPL